MNLEKGYRPAGDLIIEDADETKPTALVLRPHFLSVVPMPEERIDHTNVPSSAILPFFSAPNDAGCPAQAIGVIMHVRTLHVQTPRYNLCPTTSIAAGLVAAYEKI
jgi:hypothetical protein